MKAAAYKLANILKEINPGTNNKRLALGLCFAQNLAFTFPIGIYANAESAYEETVTKIKALINAVNDHVAIDTRLTLACYRQMLDIRFALLNGTTDSGLLTMFLNSEEAKDRLSDDQFNMAQYVNHRASSVALECQAKELLLELFNSME